ncbi:MAG: hypothetical protein ACRBC3_09705 [Burkholderiaceae bacterium]
MNTYKAVKLSFGVTLVTLLVTSGPVQAEGDLTPLSDGTPAPSWEIKRHAEGGVVELVTGNDSGSLSTMCTDDACGVFVEPQAGCIPGASYPLLINSSKRVGVVPTRCAMIPTAASGEGVRYVVMFREQNAMFQAMLEEMDLSIAFPTQSGDMNVINVAMSGVRDMLASVLPNLPEVASNMGVQQSPSSPLEQLEWSQSVGERLYGYDIAGGVSVNWTY